MQTIMALDRQHTSIYYRTGRLIAITEHYAGKQFGPGTLSTMFNQPRHSLEVFRRYIDTADEYYQDVADLEPEVTTPNEVVKSQMWVGYYHQKAAYDDTTRGGYRPGGGRPSTDRTHPLSVRISKEAADKLERLTRNKSEYIDNLIKNQPEKI